MQSSQFDYTFVKHLYNRFKDVYFEDKTHTYYNKGNKLISVTQAIKLFEPEFDKEYWSNYKAKQRGVTQDVILQEWEETKNIGLERGNIIHDYIEATHKRELKPSIPYTSVNAYLESNTDIPFLSEFIIGTDCIGGKFDNLSIRDNYLIIKDWKGNKKFEIESPYKLCNGLEHLPNTEYYKYALQVSLYRYILDLDDIQQMEVVWFNNDTYQIFDMPYLKDEAEYIHNYVNSRSYSNT